mmetsp:Transcript_13740/g.44452  ORF Transcript_13740/g.44452 Transcript_13740/m.44452 type:complete len:202 (-) Transcript_13740:395-1000(-)
MRKYCGDIALPDPLVAIRSEREEDRQDDRFKTDVHTFDHSVSSLHFWAYGKMLLGIANSLITLQTWVEGCSCHQAKYFWNTVGTGRSFMARRARLKREFGTAFASSCPRAGCRAPELAVGHALEILDQVLAEDYSAVAMLLPGLGDARRKLLEDWSLGRQHVVQTLTTKLSCWHSLPLQLCGVAHYGICTARDSYRKSLAM